MRRLLLLRHAKAVAKNADRDFERPLAARGRAEMKLVARHLAADEARPDLAVVSPAARTRETWERAGLADVPVRFETAIYDAEAETLLDIVRGLPATVRTAILVGHNPGFEDLGCDLIEGGAPPDLKAGLPTAGLVSLDVPGETWGEAGWGTCRLVRVVTPASLAP